MAEGSNRRHSHIYLPGHGSARDYTAHSATVTPPPLPDRDRQQHAEALTLALRAAVQAGARQIESRDATLAGGVPGFYLEFELPAAHTDILDRLEYQGRGRVRTPIELASAREIAGGKIAATVFVPESHRDHYFTTVAAYRDEETPTGQPRNQPLVAAIDTVRLALAQSLYTDKPGFFPASGVVTWWEVWLRAGTLATFETAAQRLNLSRREHALSFPDRDVVLVCASIEQLSRIVANTDAVAELRIARDTPGVFMTMDGAEQRQWSDDLATRIEAPPDNAPAVCLLDSGTTIRHPLIACGLSQRDHQAYRGDWLPEDISAADHGGHGTGLSGIALHGDLADVLGGNEAITLGHRLESVKILPDRGANDPDLYGYITQQAVAVAEIAAPARPRAICLAVTAAGDHWRGRPSSWSAALDELAYGEVGVSRLIAVSAGNIGVPIAPGEYLTRNDTTPIESPAQAWNALTIGAFTEKTVIADPSFAGWQTLAPAGDLTGTSRTSASWNHDWPLKPDLVLEGGNHGVDPATGTHDSIDDLALLTTYRRPEERAFTVTGETSAATALAARMAARIFAEKPELWPETVRALMIHSAEWTPAMKAHLSAGEIDKARMLRRYGFGVPSLARALRSLDNDVAIVIENTMRPFRFEDSKVKTRDLVLHALPWPTELLQAHGEETVELRITLSYFIEPNPGERGDTKRHSYASHGLRFDVKRPGETDDLFMRRLNAQAGQRPTSHNDTGWNLGPRLRHRGSIHSDIWSGSAADLAARGAIAVYPVGGWWREKIGHRRWDSPTRHGLVISLRTTAAIDLYNAVLAAIGTGIPVMT